ncbi:DNA polymerase-3 subunit gamma/tau [Oikeobacillus pervagus]|uniref:DNA-directed DNA polymerase n=1 Tax=Oikeobacillus pervagus TaxID=1325931 RepID=A0AAJ1T8G2_9BACI|nr:DNA polymerase III subunit gamma/tau [Oikeobacillus pervagus]MDQ0216530.1 DNA polymerase-3 subunit gamma/tau [Oikeobacillus pervagus]
MGYQALYRVWRPQTFVDVVGQEHVTKTLQNALLQQKTSHAYLFSGPRGTGKTSAAKILAKAVNCERGPASEPCNECAACRGITDGSIPDVIEFDAASNSRVEEMREVLDKVKYAPSVVNYKVYIIDEVHMLSISAFNALLKTLEEPPKHVLFILATTEPHKIPLTIISRCQRFDFKRITSKDIVKRMKLIVEESGISVEENALHIIARAAEGGMRDALSLLDQAISFSSEMVTVEDALAVTGTVSQTYLNRMGRSILEKDTVGALETVEELLLQGKDPGRFTEDFILYFRDMLLYKTAPNIEESLERVMLDDDFVQLTNEISPEQIYEYIDILNKAQHEMKFSNHARIYLEVSLVKMCQINVRRVNNIPEIEGLLDKIQKMEMEIKSLQSQRSSMMPGESERQTTRKPSRPSSKGFKTPVKKIEAILKEATKQDLNLVKSRWGDMLDFLNQRQMRSQAALLNDAEPVAASPHSFVLKFKYEIHCQMAMENVKFIQTLAVALQELTGNEYYPVGVPEEEWLKIRKQFIQGERDHKEQEEDPLISEALKLVGEDLLEIKD